MRKILTAIAMVFLVLGVHPLMAAKAKAAPQHQLININTATEAQLVKLPGIGPKKARRIVETRKRLGGFKRVEDIMKVKGIGEKTFQRIRKLITVR